MGFWPQNEKSYKLKNGGFGVKFGGFGGFDGCFVAVFEVSFGVSRGLQAVI